MKYRFMLSTKCGVPSLSRKGEMEARPTALASLSLFVALTGSYWFWFSCRLIVFYPIGFSPSDLARSLTHAKSDTSPLLQQTTVKYSNNTGLQNTFFSLVVRLFYVLCTT